MMPFDGSLVALLSMRRNVDARSSWLGYHTRHDEDNVPAVVNGGTDGSESHRYHTITLVDRPGNSEHSRRATSPHSLGTHDTDIAYTIVVSICTTTTLNSNDKMGDKQQRMSFSPVSFHFER